MKAYFRLITPLLLPLIFCDIFCIVLIWFTDVAHGSKYVFLILVFNILYLLILSAVIYSKKRDTDAAIKAFLNEANAKTAAELKAMLPAYMHPLTDGLNEVLKAREEEIKRLKTDSSAYINYIDEWTHEIKTPLSLLSLMLVNRKAEMSEYVLRRMMHINRKLTDDVEKILFYSRINSGRPDINFTRFRLDELVSERINEFEFLIGEAGGKIKSNLNKSLVTADKKTMGFIIDQLLSNAAKYMAKSSGIIEISLSQNSSDTAAVLTILNNGGGVLPEDAPFIFDMGFCGGIERRQRATGMGLYLASRYAEANCAKLMLSPISTKGEFFEISLIIPADSE
ncbi:MAG: HAMP domain-containing histidine kinase [Ruminococcaceae bacterium]|nr:HAMP domain-containing histidine kinase [Oscillospiraceae bacterium]